jgi:2-oxoglutarate dehydrogenase complex dehydrogenase (E1) component-like enzyme
MANGGRARRQLGRARKPAKKKIEKPKRMPKAGVTVSADDVAQATRDSVRAIMMIRAYRMRGHLHADLDPLGDGAAQGITSSARHPTAFRRPISTADLHRPRAGA